MRFKICRDMYLTGFLVVNKRQHLRDAGVVNRCIFFRDGIHLSHYAPPSGIGVQETSPYSLHSDLRVSWTKGRVHSSMEEGRRELLGATLLHLLSRAISVYTASLRCLLAFTAHTSTNECTSSLRRNLYGALEPRRNSSKCALTAGETKCRAPWYLHSNMKHEPRAQRQPIPPAPHGH